MAVRGGRGSFRTATPVALGIVEDDLKDVVELAEEILNEQHGQIETPAESAEAEGTKEDEAQEVGKTLSSPPEGTEVPATIVVSVSGEESGSTGEES